jgi:hypothetical protein
MAPPDRPATRLPRIQRPQLAMAEARAVRVPGPPPAARGPGRVTARRREPRSRKRWIWSYWQPRCRSSRCRPVALRPRLSTGLPCISGADYATKTRVRTATFVAIPDPDGGPVTRKPIPISDLLALGQSPLKRLQEGAEAAGEALAAVRQFLPEELRPRVWAASVEGGVLTILVASGAWASRVRYCAADLAAGVAERLGGAISRVAVRVRPPGQVRPATGPRSRQPPGGG